MIILCAHGKYAEETKNSLEMIVGPQAQVKYVNFTMDMATIDIIEKYKEIISSNPQEQDINIFCDIHGGSPANAAYILKKHHPHVRVFTGLNLPLVLALSMEENIELALSNARDEIREV